MKKYIILIISISVFFLITATSLAGIKIIKKSGFELYEERVEKICKQYEPAKKIFSTENFNKLVDNSNKDKVLELKNKEIGGSLEQAGTDTKDSAVNYGKDAYNAGKNSFSGVPFNVAKSTYKDNMNNIYKCMILNSQKASLNLINKDLIKNNPELKKLISKKIESKLNKIKMSFNKLKCMKLGEENNSLQKLKLLDQTTFELCKYHSYLEYLREYNSDYNNIEIPENGSKNTKDLLKQEEERKNQIDNEIEHIYKVFPIAFTAYKQYEDNLSTHLLLELIKEDYIALRESLHGSLNPINQVVYKIANAMKK